MVTVLRTPARPTLVRPATCTWSVTYEESYCAFCEERVGRHRHRIRSDRRRHFARDHRCGQRPRFQPEHQVHLDQHLAEISDGSGRETKAPAIPGPSLFRPAAKWRAYA